MARAALLCVVRGTLKRAWHPADARAAAWVLTGLHAGRERALHLRPDRVRPGVLLLRGAGHVRPRAARRAGGRGGRAGRQPARRGAVVAGRHRVPAGAGARVRVCCACCTLGADASACEVGAAPAGRRMSVLIDCVAGDFGALGKARKHMQQARVNLLALSSCAPAACPACMSLVLMQHMRLSRGAPVRGEAQAQLRPGRVRARRATRACQGTPSR